MLCTERQVLRVKSRASSGERHVESVKWRASSGQRHVESVMWRASSGERHVESVKSRASSGERHVESVKWRTSSGERQVDSFRWIASGGERQAGMGSAECLMGGGYSMAQSAMFQFLAVLQGLRLRLGLQRVLRAQPPAGGKGKFFEFRGSEPYQKMSELT